MLENLDVRVFLALTHSLSKFNWVSISTYLTNYFMIRKKCLKSICLVELPVSTSLLPDLYIGTCLVIYNEDKYLSYATAAFLSNS